VKGARIQKKLTGMGSFLIFWLAESDSPEWQPTLATNAEDFPV